ADRTVALGAARARAGRADPAAGAGAAVGVRLLLLGSADNGRAFRCRSAAAGAPEQDRPVRDRRPQDRALAQTVAPGRAAACDPRRGALGPRAPGGRRLVGRDPAA